MTRLLAAVALLTCTAAAAADNWPAWRGPTGQGHCAEKGLPTTWGPTENIKWKVPLAHPGNSTPVVWGDRIFLTMANKGGSVRSLLCFARADGKHLWKSDVRYTAKERNWTQDWYCNASPVTDGERVVVSHGSAGMYCYDFQGKELWKRTDLGKFDHQFGNAASPVLYNDLCILWCGPNEKVGRNYLLAVNKQTGKTVWQRDEKAGSWVTPVVAQVEGRDQLLYCADFKFRSVDPKDGKPLWSCDGLTIYVYTSPLYSAKHNSAVAMSGFNGAALAVNLGGSGNITKDRLWLHPKNIQRVGSGVLVDDHVYIMEESGVPHCYELQTGKEVWKVAKRPTTLNWGSMVHADGKIYVMARDGTTFIFKAGPKYELLATNRLSPGETTNSSPAISNGDIFLRTNQHLWCVGVKR